MKTKRTSAGLALAAGAVIAGRYLRDPRARGRLARLERRSMNTPFGRLEYCEWGKATRSCSSTGSSAAATCPAKDVLRGLADVAVASPLFVLTPPALRNESVRR